MKNLELLKEDMNTPFDLARMDMTRNPVDLGSTDELGFDDLSWHIRVRNYCIKLNNSDKYIYDNKVSDKMSAFIAAVSDKLDKLGINRHEHYCYLTFEDKFIDAGNTPRLPGWHLDGMQGDEVPVKKNVNINVIAADHFPTIYTNEKFDMSEVDASKTNVFKWIDERVDRSRGFEGKVNNLYLMSAYQAHVAKVADYSHQRKFIRICWTHIPFTSVNMVVNDNIEYNYDIHTTTGMVSEHLK